MIISLAIIRTLGIILFLYLVWRNLRDDYPSEDLVVYGWLAVLIFLFGGRLAFGLMNWGVWNGDWVDWVSFWNKPGEVPFAGYLVMVSVTWWWCEVKKWKVWSFLEDMSLIFSLLMSMVLLDSSFRSGWYGLVDAIVWLSSIVVVLGLSGRYRSFTWYRSGKKGFLFLMANIYLWLMMAIIHSNVWYAGFSLLSIMGLFILGDVFAILKIKKRSK